MDRFVTPEPVRLEISGGDWIVIKKELNAGEYRGLVARTVKTLRAGERQAEVDIEAMAFVSLVEYLLDWSLTDRQGQPVVIKSEPGESVEQSRAKRLNALRNLTVETFDEINAAVEAHQKALAEEKKTPTTASASFPTSASAA